MENKKKNSLDNLSIDVTNVLCSSNLKDVSIDLAELTLDSILKNEALKSIPVVKI